VFKQEFTNTIGGFHLIGVLINLLGFLVTAFLPELPLLKAESFEQRKFYLKLHQFSNQKPSFEFRGTVFSNVNHLKSDILFDDSDLF
jgi:hypothetical protein